MEISLTPTKLAQDHLMAVADLTGCRLRKGYVVMKPRLDRLRRRGEMHHRTGIWALGVAGKEKGVGIEDEIEKKAKMKLEVWVGRGANKTEIGLRIDSLITESVLIMKHLANLKTLMKTLKYLINQYL